MFRGLLSLHYKAQYIAYKATLPKCIHHAKKSHYSDKLKQAQNDPQGTWKVINDVLKLILNDTSFNIKAANKVTSKPKERAISFNDCFSHVAENLASNIHALSCDPLSQISRLNASFAFFNITTHEVKKAILSFKSKSSSMKEFPLFVFKHVADVVSPILCNLFNGSVHN